MPVAVTLPELPANSKIIDIRPACEYMIGHFQDAVNIPYEILMNYPDSYLKHGETYYLICAHGSLSHRACAILQAYGYDVASVKNGYEIRCYCW